MRFVHPHRGPWRTVSGDDGPLVSITPQPHLLLSLAEWHAVRGHWPQGMPVGVQFANDLDVEVLEVDLPRLALVALEFPKWTDGRAYSQARLLRSRLRYAGEVRATGEVLVDMLPLLARTGFDAVALRADQRQDAAERALGYFGGHYQGDMLDAQPLFAKPPGWAEHAARPPVREFVDAGVSI
ncbi:MAG: DUF934 domain-containing protein [Rhizobacter sp.]|nr:DUF934 domain-containing protein [Rhizobacter sp.]